MLDPGWWSIKTHLHVRPGADQRKEIPKNQSWLKAEEGWAALLHFTDDIYEGETDV